MEGRCKRILVIQGQGRRRSANHQPCPAIRHPTEGCMKSSLKKASEPIMRWFSFLAFCLIALPVFAQTRQPDKTSPAPPPADDQEEPVIPGDWAPELLDAILTSPSPDARDALLDATFAAGPPIIPQLEAALKDDRTAEFAAQSLAFIGGPKAFTILGKLVADPRDLDLRRFFYGALGELRTPEATRFLMDAVTHSDAEPDRTVTEAAIIALTARSDVEMLPPLPKPTKRLKTWSSATIWKMPLTLSKRGRSTSPLLRARARAVRWSRRCDLISVRPLSRPSPPPNLLSPR